MSRTVVNFILDCWLLTALLALMWVATMVQFTFPPGAQSQGWTLWGLDYDGWCKVQFGCLAAFVLSILLHLILHWTWVCGFVGARLARLRGRKYTHNSAINTLYGVGLLIALLTLLGALLTAAEFAIRPPG